MRVDNKIYWSLFQNLFTETTLLLEWRQQTKETKQNKTKQWQNQRAHYRKNRVGEGGQGIFEMVGTCVLSCVWLFASPWTVACQSSLFMNFSRQEYWSGLPFSISGVNLLSCNQSYQWSWSFKLLLSWEDMNILVFVGGIWQYPSPFPSSCKQLTRCPLLLGLPKSSLVFAVKNPTSPQIP